MLDRLTGMRVLARAAQAGSLSAAGRQLGMSAAMATKHIDALEARLGIKLLHRSTRGLTLTDVGANYLEACLRILDEVDEAEAAAASQRVDATGLLRMNVPLSFGTRFIAPLMPEFARRHPAVTVELGLNDSQIDLIDGGWDMGVRIGRLANAPMQARQLSDCPMLVCAAPTYLARHGMPRSVTELADHNCLGYSLSPLAGPGEWAFGRDGQIRVSVRGDLIANNGAALVAAAIGGQGIVYQPQFIVGEALRRGALQILTLDQPCYALGGIHAIYPRNRRPPAKVRAMIDYLVEAFQSRGDLFA
ncbi:LysR family transcriptional regulator [Stutzerimonas azotifigens]|uniref:LysR family transcriptional regulator n=1 Tax=Stutzerimonas azotifigens TaxID=291995 RepID=A0ABR5Z1N6_9GAMM|nr:LysR family transcriptional regulator [Stutzerimonas azotifigens]MBA1274069.1 LysR family transcriptional regulator [Stutzerimonas azotifigens]